MSSFRPIWQKWFGPLVLLLIPLCVLLAIDNFDEAEPRAGHEYYRELFTSNFGWTRDPLLADSFPRAPRPCTPGEGDTVLSSVVILEVENMHNTNDDLIYELAVYADSSLTVLVDSVRLIPGSLNHTSWTIGFILQNDSVYWWRCRSIGKLGPGPWSSPQHFIVAPKEEQHLPIAAFSTNATAGCAPIAITFTNESTGNIDSCLWDFGDGTSSTVPNPKHQYVAKDVYSVSLIVMGNQGSDTVTLVDYISVDTKPTPAFTASPIHGIRPLTVDFNNQSADATSYIWRFGDGTNSTVENPRHTYEIPGTYTVSLTSVNACGSAEEIKANHIKVEPCQPPAADFSSTSTLGRAPFTVDFISQSFWASSWSWDFGDNHTSNLEHPRHTYTKAGKYTVTLAVGNDCGCHQQKKSDFVTVTRTEQKPLHINAISVAIRSWLFFRRATVNVQVVDYAGSPVHEATVFGHWSDNPENVSVFTTDLNGWGFVHDTWKSSEANMVFCVSDITKEGWLHDTGADEMTCSNDNGNFPPAAQRADNVSLKEIESALQHPLIANYPNPFNETTAISLFLPEDCLVSIDIYNSLGQRIRHLLDEYVSAGISSVTWNGTDDNRTRVASGLYFCHITYNGRESINKKMLLIR